MEILRKKRYVGLAGIVLLILGSILPYFTWNIYGIKGKISLIGYWEGYVVIVAAVACALFIFKDFVEKYVPNAFNGSLLGKIKDANPKLLIIPIIIAALVALYLTKSINVTKSVVKHGLGFYALWGGVILLLAHTFIYKPDKGEETVVVAQQPVNNYVNPEPVQPVYNTPQQSFEQPVVEPVQPVNTFASVEPVAQQQPGVPVSEAVSPVIPVVVPVAAAVSEPVQTPVATPVQPVNTFASVEPTVPQQPVVEPEPVQQPVEQTNSFIPQQPVVEPEPVSAPAFQQPAFIPSAEPAKFCPGCGTKVDQNTTVCPTCGRAI